MSTPISDLTTGRDHEREWHEDLDRRSHDLDRVLSRSVAAAVGAKILVFLVMVAFLLSGQIR